MITFNESLFLYENKILVIDCHSTIKNVPQEVKFKFKNEQYDAFYIKFSTKIPENIADSKNLLFTSYNIDEKFIKKTIIKEENKQKYIYFPNICLPKSISISSMTYMLGYLFNINRTSVTILSNYENGNQNLCSFNKRDFKTNEPDYKFPHQTILKDDDYNVAINVLFIGNTNNLIIRIVKSDSMDISNYDEIFYKDYYIMMNRIRHILENTKKQNISTLQLSINYTQIGVMLCYHAPAEAMTRIDIAKLFCIHNSSNYSKVYIHSDNIDNYLSNPRPMQYLKTSDTLTNVFKGVESLFNTCVLYVGQSIEEGLTLQRIEIYPSMNINLIFTNINVNASWEHLSSVLKTWIDQNYIRILKKIKLNEAIYSLKFDYNYYIPYFSKIIGSVNLPSLTITDIEDLNELIQLETCNARFKTRTSIEFNTYDFMNVVSKQNYVYLKGVHEFITVPIAYKELLPSVHVGINNDKGDLTFKNITSYECVLFILGLVVGSFKKLKLSDTSAISSSTSISLSEKMDIKEIRKNSMKYGKNLLKVLEKIDPHLFGPRKINRGVRSFSGLCQKQKQRVVPITKEEYEYLHKIVPMSVANLANQTYEQQRVYLFCPYEKYPFLNYHSFPHQLCIVRCTTKSSNRTQYNFCANSLGAEHINEINNRYENQTITLYNPLITKGRKCKLPEEFGSILVNFVLIKLNIDSNVIKYCKDEYDKAAFIIKRDNTHGRYLILTEYNKDNDYVLIICDEIPDEYFIVIDEKTSRPLVFSEFPELKKFFIDNIRKTDEQYNFFNFLEEILNVNLSEQYNQTTNTLINNIRKEYGVRYVSQNDRIVGVIHNKKFYSTPSMYWMFETDIGFTVLFKVIDDMMKNNILLPKVEEFDIENITKIYVDYSDKTCHMVLYKGVSMWVEPFSVTAEWKLKHDVILFDNKAKLMSLYNMNIERKMNTNNTQIKILDIAEVLRNYIYIYLIDNDKIEVDKILKQLQELEIVYEGKTFIDHVNRKLKTNISWRTSKINIEDFNEYFKKYADLNPNSIIKTIYDKLQEELEFQPIKDEIISSKIITV